ncbi:hypothetical protein AARAC_000214, partial [Aspergillus arachidicola]
MGYVLSEQGKIHTHALCPGRLPHQQLDFTGPNLYIAIPRHAENKRLNLDSGKKEDGTKLQLFSSMDDSTYGPDQRFLFAYAGKDEYLIINAKSGTYLTSA